MDGWPDFKKTLGGWPLAWASGQEAARQVWGILTWPGRWLREALR